MTTSLDAYRSDREQLLARVRELEGKLAELETKTTDTEPIKFPTKCPACGTQKKNGTPIQDSYNTWAGWTYPRIRRGFWHWLFCRQTTRHFHQRCTACGARWVVDAEGWRFD